ncbi:MAG: serine/threonine-protein kinase [Byssovorax sp.]
MRFASPFSRAAIDLVGLTVDGLLIESLLAEGGIGRVYAALGLDDGERFALKVLRPELAIDPGMRSRLRREIAFLQRVSHPNVVAVRASGDLDDGRPYFVMDLHEGMTLSELVRREGPLPIPRALALIDQVLDGLGALHDAGVVHRDLQPRNLLVTRDPATGEERVILIDLGFAHEPGVDTGDGVTPDSPGSAVGTIPFLAPEQVTGGRAITPRSDLFAAGLLLYYAITGTLPFQGGAGPDRLINLLRRAPIPLRRLRRDAPRSLQIALDKAFAKHPDARYAGAPEMRAALRAAVPSG